MKKEITNIEKFDHIKYVINSIFDVDLHDEEQLKNRKPKYRDSRYVYFKILKDTFPKISLSEIGSSINKDHATVLNALRKLPGNISSSSILNKKYNACVNILNDYKCVDHNHIENKISLIELLSEKESQLDYLSMENFVLRQKVKYSNKKFKNLDQTLNKIKAKDVDGLIHRIEAYAKMCESKVIN